MTGEMHESINAFKAFEVCLSPKSEERRLSEMLSFYCAQWKNSNFWNFWWMIRTQNTSLLKLFLLYLPGRSYPGIVCWYPPLYPDSHGGPFLCKHFHRMIAPSASGRPEKIGGAHINRRSISAWGCSCTPCTPNSILVPTVFRIM